MEKLVATTRIIKRLHSDFIPKIRDVLFNEIIAIQANKWLTKTEKEINIRRIRAEFKDEKI